MVVMEGTTNTTGTLDGKITDPAKLSGGMRNFLLSDRWFSWDYPIEAEIGLTSSTGLVEEVKRLMVEQISKIYLPTSPTERTKVGVFKREWDAPQKPAAPISPKELKKPKEPAKTIKAMFIEFIRSVVYLVIALIIINFMFSNDALAKLSGAIFGGGVVFIALYSFSKKVKVGAYEEKLKRWPEELERYEHEKMRYKNDMELHKRKIQEYEKQREEYDVSLDEKEKKELSLYKKRLAEYEAGKSNVIKARELLWERARVCMRCGTAYLGSD